MKLFLKGERCFSAKCAVVKRNFPPGQHKRRMNKPTEYAIQLREKQKAKRIYNVTEQQFANYYKKAVEKKGAVTGDLLLSLLERRFDNVLVRTGIADSRWQARQFISHGLFLLNGKKVTIPSIHIKAGDVFEVAQRLKGSPTFARLKDKKVDFPPYIEFDLKALKGSVTRELERDDLPEDINAQLIVEYYSR